MNNITKKAFILAVVASSVATANAVTLMDTSSTWNYLHPEDATDPGVLDSDFDTTWYTQNDTGNSYNGPSFTDSGSGIFLYGGIGYATNNPTVPTTALTSPASGNRFSAYFASTFDLDTIAASNVDEFTINILADDGAFIYVNGQLAGNINSTGQDADYFFVTGSGSSNETTLTTLTLDKSTLIDGVNSIAVSVHNQGSGSSDLGFYTESLDVTVVPEPSSTILLGLGGIALIMRKRR